MSSSRAFFVLSLLKNSSSLMAKYYALIAGLPNLSIEQQKPPYTQDEFYAELEEILSKKDLALLDWLRLEQSNKELIRLYRAGAFEPRPEGQEDPEEEDDAETLLPTRELRRIATLARQGEWVRKSELLSYYMLAFVRERYYEPSEADADTEGSRPLSPLSDEDRLAQLYYNAAANSKNEFVASWFRFNQILRNLLALFTCRRLDWEPRQYLVGDDEITEKLLTSKAKDFDLSEEVPYISSLITIAEETDIAKRERMIDALRWRWLEDETDWTVFDIENVLSYYLRLGIIERWDALDKEKGAEVFRQIVMGLKAESNASLSEFKLKANRK